MKITPYEHKANILLRACEAGSPMNHSGSDKTWGQGSAVADLGGGGVHLHVNIEN